MIVFKCSAPINNEMVTQYLTYLSVSMKTSNHNLGPIQIAISGRKHRCLLCVLEFSLTTTIFKVTLNNYSLLKLCSIQMAASVTEILLVIRVFALVTSFKGIPGPMVSCVFIVFTHPSHNQCTI